jgi:hypothetical protein
MVPITIGVELVIQKRSTQAEILRAAAEAGLVVRIVQQPEYLPFLPAGSMSRYRMNDEPQSVPAL